MAVSINLDNPAIVETLDTISDELYDELDEWFLEIEAIKSFRELKERAGWQFKRIQLPSGKGYAEGPNGIYFGLKRNFKLLSRYWLVGEIQNSTLNPYLIISNLYSDSEFEKEQDRIIKKSRRIR